MPEADPPVAEIRPYWCSGALVLWCSELMFNFILGKIIGSQNERELRRLKPRADLISSLEAKISALSDNELRAKTDEFRQRLAKGETLEALLPEAFAVVREVGKRTVRMRHFDVQLVGGIVLHEGKIAEMATGEGKTLVATLAVYLNGLGGRGVHLVTVNDYLARRDREWMGPIYEFLGLSCGAIQHDMGPQQRQRAYACDVTYGTNNEFGFDYLRDNMVMHREERVQRELNFAIVDEVDSILVDEARTPLIISGPADESTDKYYKIDRIIPRLTKGERDETTKEESGDYIVDEKAQTAYLTEQGEVKAAQLLGLDNLHDIDSMEHKHHINQALRAHNLFKRDTEYVIRDGKVTIVDEFTGRMMSGRRWSDGLHQAIEAKEGVKIERENQTLATVTFQNYFRMYKKLAGMTGTAITEAGEFREIYKLETVVIPPNRTLVRTNHPDVIYKTEREKFKAVCDEIEELHRKGRPVLVGTISIDRSERISEMLRQRGIPHNVLNAKHHEMEAKIVAQTGGEGSVTIATNMAGRGTDIILGGNPEFMTDDLLRQKELGPYDSGYEREKEELLTKFREKVEKERNRVIALGGLHILGTERHEARRIDNQLRGRAGRQGDPGSSRFYLSLEDDLMRIFGSDRIAGVMDRLGMEEGQDIQHPFVSRAIEVAQRRVESHNFEIRKQLLKYDDVMNRQREVIYEERRMVLEGKNLKQHIYEMVDDVLTKITAIYLSLDSDPDEWDWDGLVKQIKLRFNLSLGVDSFSDRENIDKIREDIYKRVTEAYEAKEKMLGSEVMRDLERAVMLQVTDSKWKDHLYAMDLLREGIGLRAYGQRDPLVEYQHEGYEMFSDMIESIKEEVTEFVFSLQPVGESRVASVFSGIPQEFVHRQLEQFSGSPEQRVSPVASSPEPPRPYQRGGAKVGRNDPCPCGAINPNTGKPIKYKKCHGK